MVIYLKLKASIIFIPDFFSKFLKIGNCKTKDSQTCFKLVFLKFVGEISYLATMAETS